MSNTETAEGIDSQIAMVLDLNKCIGCQTCTIACKTNWTDEPGREYMYWNNVETKPGEGYPRGWEDGGDGWTSEDRTEVDHGEIPELDDYGRSWEFNHGEVFYEGSDDHVAPASDPEWGPNWDEDEGDGQYPNSYYFYLPRICNHCTHPACVEACPRKAVYKRSEDGIVLVDQERCRGYRYCVEGCPYDKIYFNMLEKTAEKCIFCYPRIEGNGPDGEQHATACADACVTQLRYIGRLDDPDGPIYKLVEEWEVALPLHPEYHTDPNVFYIPPSSPGRHTPEGESTDADRIPPAYLEELFGEDVHDALATLERERERVRSGQESELMELLTTTDEHAQYKIGGFADD
ncbi:4Fe-4S dicluster domain-containing protein [Salinilacihabitans rarus]|uniref:4Fe-4S dicluster domain-containing protein n=1 Tax=Salinilacihabitans rarus TaxID=2961596 RepID=UPI0020C86438|nr:4Fe-4S dicluster domain-containing protein [Salinilacihabitans rarus]